MQDAFRPITCDDEWQLFNQRLETDSVFKLAIKLLLNEQISRGYGLNQSKMLYHVQPQRIQEVIGAYLQNRRKMKQRLLH